MISPRVPYPTATTPDGAAIGIGIGIVLRDSYPERCNGNEHLRRTCTRHFR